ncbi:MAG: hypothetical protein U0807_13240 [Candidatus Binatia bacterium]
MTLPRPALVVTAAMLALASGCLTVESTLRADGSGTVRMVYSATADATEQSERARFSSDHVRVESLDLRSDHTGTVTVAVDDATKLATAEGFKTATVLRGKAGERTDELRVVLANPTPAKVPDHGQQPMRVRITLPGKVVEANGGATVTDATAAWTIPMHEFASRSSTELRVRYETPAAAPDATALTPKTPAS